jgi:putative SOS response-associated peptidase YedK
MCGRFLVNKSTELLEAFVGSPLPAEFARKEVFPSQPVLAVTPEGITTLNWGLRVEWQKAPIINARSETVAEKKTFSHAFRHHRCLVPTDGYWEWTPAKKRVYFHFDDSRLFWLGGLYYPEENGSKLVLMTTAPNRVAEPIHDRMPVIIAAEEKEQWLTSNLRMPLEAMMGTKELTGFVAEC